MAPVKPKRPPGRRKAREARAGRKGAQARRKAPARAVIAPLGGKSTPAPAPAPAQGPQAPPLSQKEILIRASALAGTETCRCGCGEEVEQEGTGGARRYYLNEAHAYRAFVKRAGWRSEFLTGLDAQKIKVAEKRAARPKPVPPTRQPVTGDAAEILTARYGPLRVVAKVLETRSTSKRVLLECGHEKTAKLGETKSRCAACRHAA